METLIHADIFFLVTTIALILLTIGLIIALVYVIKILHLLHKVADIARAESDLIAEDINLLRSRMHNGTFTLGSVIQFFKNIISRKGRLKK
ncbi:MAG: hypothetical protein M3Q80_00550 [bacterium]|nr:hypothetical protein [bacterium]